MASPSTNISAEFVSPTTMRVTWSPPSGGATVTGYILHYNGSSGEEWNVTVGPTAQSYTMNIIGCVGDVNITIVALSEHLSSQPQTISVHVRKCHTHSSSHLIMCIERLARMLTIKVVHCPAPDHLNVYVAP